MAVMIDIPGVGTVEAKNAASESTLRELVKLMGGRSGGGPGPGTGNRGGPNPGGAGGGGMPNLGKIITGPLGMVATGAKLASKAATAFATATIGAASALSDLDGSASGVAQLFSSIPIVGAAFGAVAKAADDVVKSYTAVAASGASFGGSVSNFSRAASEAGMNMAEFGALIKANGQGMLGFGSNVEDGANRFAKLSKSLQQNASDLYALGYTTAELNQGLAGYGALLRTQGLQGKKSNEQLVAGAKNYMKELDMMAKVTGEERSVKEKEMQALAKDAQFNAAMAGMSEEARQSFLTTVGKLPGPLQGFVKDFLATGTLTTEATQKIGAMMGGTVMNELQSMRNKMQSGQALTAQEQDRLNAIMKAAADKQMKASGTALAASRDMDDATNAMVAAQGLNATANVDAANSQANSAKSGDKFNEKMQTMSQEIAKIANKFKDLLATSGILDVMFAAFNGLAKLAETLLIPAFNILTSAVMKIWNGFTMLLEPVITAVSGWLGGLGGTLSIVDKIMNVTFTALRAGIDAVINILDGLFTGIGYILQPLENLWAQVMTGVDGIDVFTDVIYRAGSFIGKTFEIMGFLVGGVLQGIADIGGFLYNKFMDLYNGSETLRNILDFLGTNIKMLYEGFKIVFSVEGVKWMMSSAKDTIVFGFIDLIADLQDKFGSMIDAILNAIPDALGGLSDKEKAEREATREAGKLAREEESKNRKAATALLLGSAVEASQAEDKKIEGQKAATRKASAEFAKQEISARKLNVVNGKQLDAAEKAAKAAGLNADQGPEGLLLAFAKKEGSPLVPKTEASAAATTQVAAITADADAKKVKEKKEADDKLAADKDMAATTAAMQAAQTNKPENKPATQETAESLLSQLNTNMARLIAISDQQLTINEQQLSVQRSQTGDLFASV